MLFCTQQGVQRGIQQWVEARAQTKWQKPREPLRITHNCELATTVEYVFTISYIDNNNDTSSLDIIPSQEDTLNVGVGNKEVLEPVNVGVGWGEVDANVPNIVTMVE